ncbi:hypothetical protein CAPTEDRAFT_191707 [Capitella teleta]|uniref:Apple domain-containing protein n=1 Tax=Capitella teleta TaxID=283909 RepID=R7V5V9_CAPTE|nr:hypothetical protein CAPTEDRAFT_191707 [Capitella teleta]|eukprot:ELU14238.1 hypothetical protein CAPTEDRAFT_191707 [Capitella teleta]
MIAHSEDCIFNGPEKDYTFKDPISKVDNINLEECKSRCVLHADCRSITYQSTNMLCYLNQLSLFQKEQISIYPGDSYEKVCGLEIQTGPLIVTIEAATESQTTDISTTEQQATDTPTAAQQTTDTAIFEPQTTNTLTTEPQTTKTPTTEPQTTDPLIAEPQTTDTPIVEPQTTSTPTTEPQTTDTPTIEPHTTDTPTTEPQMTDTLTTEPQITDTPPIEPQTTNTPTTEVQTTDTPTTGPQTINTPTTEPQTTDTPTTGPQTINTPTTEPQTTDTPTTEPTTAWQAIIVGDTKLDKAIARSQATTFAQTTGPDTNITQPTEAKMTIVQTIEKGNIYQDGSLHWNVWTPWTVCHLIQEQQRDTSSAHLSSQTGIASTGSVYEERPSN